MELPFRATLCGLDELAEHREARVSHVLSILDPEWPVPEIFGHFGPHERLELRFHDVILEGPGTIPPEPADIERLLAFGRPSAAHPRQSGICSCIATPASRARPPRWRS